VTKRSLETPEAHVVLELLEQADEHGITLQDLREQGLKMPALALYELELAGWDVQRSAGRIRLRDGDAPVRTPQELPPKVRILPPSRP
jgi:hypothetical protein